MISDGLNTVIFGHQKMLAFPYGNEQSFLTTPEKLGTCRKSRTPFRNSLVQSFASSGSTDLSLVADSQESSAQEQDSLTKREIPWHLQKELSPFTVSGHATPYKTARMSPSLLGSTLSSSRRQSFEEELNGAFDNETTTNLDKENDSNIFKTLVDQRCSSDKNNEEETPVEQSLDEVVSALYDKTSSRGQTNKGKGKPSLWLSFVFVVMFLILATSVLLSCVPFLTCTTNAPSGVCIPQVSIQLADSAPASKSVLSTVRELFKVLSYFLMDFGATTAEIDLINTQIDDYYRVNAIETFNEDTVYRLNYWGYCRLAPSDYSYFCMNSYGFDLLAVLIRDAGVQLAALTGTNVEIMGDSFALTYELAISSFNKLLGVEDESDTASVLDYAILLQKFSKGIACLTALHHAFEDFQLVSFMALAIMFMMGGADSGGQTKRWKKLSVISLLTASFLSVFTGFLVCSLTYQYVVKITDLATSAGIAMVSIDTGYTMIWTNLLADVIACIIVIYLANLFRKKML